jgi:transcriptional regulator with XRE-family HTH domain
MNEHAEYLRRFGEAVRQEREQQRLSVADLAVRSSIAARRISKIEAGRLDPRYDVVIALADGLGVQASTLMPKE